jgi:hypothetical protein
MGPKDRVAKQELFEFCPIDVGQLVGGDNVHIRQKVGGVLFRVGDTRFHVATGHPDLVNHLTVRGNEGIVRLTTQNVNRSRFDVIGLPFATESQLPGPLGTDDTTGGRIIVKRALQGSQQQIALGAVGENEAQAPVHFTGGDLERFAHLGHVERDAIDNEKVFFADAAILGGDGLRLGQSRADLPFHLFEVRLELVKVLAWRALGDFLRGALFRRRAHVLQLRDVSSFVVFGTQRGQKLVVSEHGIHGRAQPIIGGIFPEHTRHARLLGKSKQATRVAPLKHGTAFGGRTQAVKPHRVQTLEDVPVLAVLRRTAMFLDETFDFLEAGDDALFTRRMAAGLAGSVSTPSSSSRSRSSSVIDLAIFFLPALRCRKATPSAIRFSHGSAAVMEGMRPFSLLKHQSAFGQITRFIKRQGRPLGGDDRRNLFKPLFRHGLGKDRVGLAERVDAVDQVDVQLAHIHRKPWPAAQSSGRRWRAGARLPDLHRPDRDTCP